MNMSHTYNAQAVDQQIARDRRRHRISKREAGLIHALLQGRHIASEGEDRCKNNQQPIA